jgi:hypothetical protein
MVQQAQRVAEALPGHGADHPLDGRVARDHDGFDLMRRNLRIGGDRSGNAGIGEACDAQSFQPAVEMAMELACG